MDRFHGWTFQGDDVVAEGNDVFPLTVLEEEFAELDQRPDQE